MSRAIDLTLAALASLAIASSPAVVETTIIKNRHDLGGATVVIRNHED